MFAVGDQARSRRAAVQRADAQARDAIPASINRLWWAVEEKNGLIGFQTREGINAQKKRLV